MKKFSLVLGLFLLACLAVWGCRTAPDVVRVKMDYTPTNAVLPPKSMPQTPIFIIVQDQRKNPDQLGENTEKPKVVPVKVEPSEITPFMENAFKREFKKAGLNVVDSQAAAGRILKISILNLWVDEKSTYQATAVTQAEVLDKSGQKLFGDGFRATASRWGSSYSDTEYRKAASDVVVELIKNMFSNDAFMKSLS